MAIWNPRKEKRMQTAKQHTKEMAEKYGNEIQACIGASKFYSDTVSFVSEPKYHTTLSVEDADSVSSVWRHASPKPCVLNFASYKYPGGGFLCGSSAQEESLCHASILYNVLSAASPYYEACRNELNRSLYKNKAIFTPDVVFANGRTQCLADVITCAAPNKAAAQKYHRVTEQENRKALEDRIDFVLAVAAENKAECLILGAFGCGVFGQNPDETAQVFKAFLCGKYKNVFPAVIFAVPDASSRNFKAFRRVFSEAR